MPKQIMQTSHLFHENTQEAYVAEFLMMGPPQVLGSLKLSFSGEGMVILYRNKRRYIQENGVFQRKLCDIL